MAKTISFTTNVGCIIQCRFYPHDDIMASYTEKENIPKKIDFFNPLNFDADFILLYKFVY